ncbi:hypothetical protein POV27_15085 [Aureisphaera galaxeae]|uniref:hypothetical protein n=1 Tax=Aureisphaera galaxeae TaxID=1538023 RepID=UPI002350465D|nr:hypothetical protein [Aureisphaera galaxeae]MDC8005386.1 hypothetical protein [Aureisphaera galaxeae]
MIKWHKVYRGVAMLLHDFYNKHRENPGKDLFEILREDKPFRKNNPWADKFFEPSKSPSFDPIHLFSSFSGSSQTEKSRVDRINILVRILTSSKSFQQFKEIDFEGCPSPVTVNLISKRNLEDQKDIWSTFASVYTKKQAALNAEVFDKARKWYGIDTISFTQFLFWLDSRNFIPLDTYTISLLMSAKRIEHRPETYEDYKDLLSLRETSVYRDVTQMAYKVMKEGKQVIIYTRKVGAYLKAPTEHIRKTPFRLIAVKPVKGLATKYRKILEEDKLYKFYNAFSFHENETKVTVKGPSLDLYRVKGLPNISISAIVGKNGQGKSTISELVYMAIYNLSVAKGLLDDAAKLLEDFCIDLYYQSNYFYKMEFRNADIQIYRYEQIEDSYSNPEKLSLENFRLDQFFYTVAINYSHYGLNSRKFDYDWITPLSHKNDGYQTPVVINPMRTEGNFNINREDELLRARLLANVLEPIGDETFTLRDIAENKRAVTITLKLDHEKIERLQKVTGSKSAKTRQMKVLPLIYDHFDIRSVKGVPFKDEIESYIVQKLIEICLRYKQIYSGYYSEKSKNFYVKKIPDLLKLIDLDKSHITYKLKRAINYLKYNHYDSFLKGFKDKVAINVDKLSLAIEDIKANESDVQLETITLIPPSIFYAQIVLEDDSNLDTISSGENQMINVISSIIYHLNNLESVSISDSLYNYGFVQIMMDEVELYFHPDFQRKFIKYLLQYLSKMNLDRIEGINLCFITHSPFILSDLVKDNILFLGGENGTSSPTFGANIYNLLSDSFFMEEGTIGAFAKDKIMEVIDHLSSDAELDEKTLEEVNYIIDNIGEPLIKAQLEKLKHRRDDNLEIVRLKKEIEELKAGQQS